MTMSLSVRRLLLTAHVTTSVGWLGAVLAYLALDITATVGSDISAVRAAFLGMGVIIVYVIVPLAVISVLIGVANALSGAWGLFRHYWVLLKLLLTLFATAILLLELQNVSYMAEVAAMAADPRELPGSLPHAIGGLIVLLTAAVLSVFKPKGVTRYGWRRQHEHSALPPAEIQCR